MPAWGQLLYNHVVLKFVLSLPIGKVLTIFLHIQNAIPRIRIPRQGASSQLQLPYRHETDMSKWIRPISSHHTGFRVREDTSKSQALSKQEQNKVYCNCAVYQDKAKTKRHALGFAQLMLHSSKRSNSKSVESWCLGYESLIWPFRHLLLVPWNIQLYSLGCPDVILQNPNTTQVLIAKGRRKRNLSLWPGIS